jgi:hypothetical protein
LPWSSYLAGSNSLHMARGVSLYPGTIAATRLQLRKGMQPSRAGQTGLVGLGQLAGSNSSHYVADSSAGTSSALEEWASHSASYVLGCSCRVIAASTWHQLKQSLGRDSCLQAQLVTTCGESFFFFFLPVVNTQQLHVTGLAACSTACRVGRYAELQPAPCTWPYPPPPLHTHTNQQRRNL